MEIVTDIRGFVVVVIVLLWAFTSAFTVATAGQDNAAFPEASRGFVTVFTAALGSFTTAHYDSETSTLGGFFVFLFLVVIVMLNLLIAIMSDSYERVMEANVVEGRKLRIQTILDEEALMSSAEWDNPSYFPPYLQVLRAVDPPERAWSGLSSRPQLDHLGESMAALDSRVHERLGQLEERLEGKVLARLESLEALLRGASARQGDG